MDKQLYLELLTVQQRRRADQHSSLVNQARILFMRRNKSYGEAFTYVGLIGSVAELIGPVARLRQMVLRGELIPNLAKPEPDEQALTKVRDILLDIINYALICLMLIEDENYTGV